MIKKSLVLFLTIVLCLPLCACEIAETPETTQQEIKTTEKKLSDSEIEAKVSDALWRYVRDQVKGADAGSTRYKINKIERKSGKIYVYGTVTMYDKYGKLYKFKGEYTNSFSYTLNEDGTVSVGGGVKLQ